MKKIILLTLLAQNIAFIKADPTITAEVMELRQKFDKKEKIAFCANILPYTLGVILPLVWYNSRDAVAGTMYTAITFGGFYTFLNVWNFIENFKSRRLFKYLANKRVTPSGDLIDGELTSAYPYLLNDEQFHVLGIKAGMTEAELVKLATQIGRIDIAYKLKKLLTAPYPF